LTDTVRDYTEEVLTAFIKRGITPELVQLGNEITTGFLYPFGRVGDDDHSLGGGPIVDVYNTPEQWAQFRTLMREAIKATRSVAPDSKIILHHSRSGGKAHVVK
jgi:arabinogalactan endo-1,4-beta-galactosidase